MSSFEVLQVYVLKGEKHLAVVDVRAWGKICLRFKVVPAEKGGTFVTTGSVKIGMEDGKDKFEPCFLMEMRSEERQLRDVVMGAYRASINGQNVSSAPSVFGTAPSDSSYPDDSGVPF